MERHADRLRLPARVDDHLLQLVQLRRVLAGVPDADLDALTSMLIGSFYGRYVTIAGIPDDWPDRVLSAIWPAA